MKLFTGRIYCQSNTRTATYAGLALELTSTCTPWVLQRAVHAPFSEGFLLFVQG